jgi:hypothetical protein
MKEGRFFFKIFFIVSLFVFAHGFAISFSEPQIEVEITDPEKDGMQVGKEMDVKGTASVPSGKYLWVLIHREDFEDVWWPQNEAKINPETNQWKAHVVFGVPGDVGYVFEIAAIVVSNEEHLKLKNYRKEAMLSGDWRPISMPPTLTAPTIRRVNKASH